MTGQIAIVRPPMPAHVLKALERSLGRPCVYGHTLDAPRVLAALVQRVSAVLILTRGHRYIDTMEAQQESTAAMVALALVEAVTTVPYALLSFGGTSLSQPAMLHALWSAAGEARGMVIEVRDGVHADVASYERFVWSALEIQRP